jgi:hypothetical protein
VLMTRATGFAVGLKELQAQFTFDFHGFLAPLANPPAVNRVGAGSTVPVKFSLGGDQGLEVLAAGSPTVQPVFCGTTTPSGAATAAAGPGLRYDPTTDEYVFAWMTAGSRKGTCARLDVRLSDGTTHSADFSFK